MYMIKYCNIYVYDQIMYNICIWSNTVLYMYMIKYCNIYVYDKIMYYICIWSNTVLNMYMIKCTEVCTTPLHWRCKTTSHAAGQSPRSRHAKRHIPSTHRGAFGPRTQWGRVPPGGSRFQAATPARSHMTSAHWYHTIHWPRTAPDSPSESPRGWILS